MGGEGLGAVAASLCLYNRLASEGPCYEDASDDDEDRRELYGSHLQFEVEPSVHDARDEGTADPWIERNPSLIRLTNKHPLNCEPPLTRLMHHGFITPGLLHYVRNHSAVPRGDWSTWTLEVTGGPPGSPGSGSARHARLHGQPAQGAEHGARRWGSTGRRRGHVHLRVARRAPPRRATAVRHDDQALNMCFEGAEDLPGGGSSKYGTSITREWALDLRGTSCSPTGRTASSCCRTTASPSTVLPRYRVQGLNQKITPKLREQPYRRNLI